MLVADATVEIGRPRSAETNCSVAALSIVCPSAAVPRMSASNVIDTDCAGARVPPTPLDAPLPSQALTVFAVESYDPAPLPEPPTTVTFATVAGSRPAGIGSLSCTPVALPVPLLVAVIVYRTVSPGSASPVSMYAADFVSVTFGENSSVANVIACGAYVSPFVLARNIAVVAPFGRKPSVSNRLES